MKKKRKIKLDYKDLETIRDFGSAMIADSVKINMEKQVTTYLLTQ